MLFITALDFTKNPEMFLHLQNRGEELLLSAGRKMMKSIRHPFILIATCDRAEVLSEERIPSEIMERSLSLSPAAVRDMRYSLEGEEALLHVFLLASGIISPLFGEDTIQGQMNDAASAARLTGSSSPYLDKLINMAVSFSKRIHSERTLRVFDSSVTEAVCRMCDGRRSVLIVGSGALARRTAAALAEGHDVTMTLRDAEKTFLVPPGVRPAPYEDRVTLASSADAVISASSGLMHTFSGDELKVLNGKTVFDLASPPDLPPSFPAIRTADLGVEEPEKERAAAVVRKMAEEECISFNKWLERRDGMEMLRAGGEALSYEVLRRLAGPISSLCLSAEKEKALRAAVSDSVRKAFVSQSLGRKKI